MGDELVIPNCAGLIERSIGDVDPVKLDAGDRLQDTKSSRRTAEIEDTARSVGTDIFINMIFFDISNIMRSKRILCNEITE